MASKRWGAALAAVAIALPFAASPFTAQALEQAPLVLEARIPLGKVSGRIDHLALDRARQRLFVAELGNDSLGIVDLKQRTLLRHISGLDEPSGVAYIASADAVFVANAGDGSVRVWTGEDFAPVGRIALKNDADNLRADQANGLVIAGFGSGALAVIDAKTRQTVRELPLKGHPEGFQLEPSGQRIFVNVPDAREVAVIARASGLQIGAWKNPDAHANFPMAIRQDGTQVLVVYRSPAPRLAVFDTATGAISSSLSTCNDADDVFVDEQRQRIYISCGDGMIDVLGFSGSDIKHIAQITTVSGARTSLYDPELDRLFLAVRASSGEPAAIWVYRPQ